MNLRLSGKRALVTGSSVGIGEQSRGHWPSKVSPMRCMGGNGSVRNRCERGTPYQA